MAVCILVDHVLFYYTGDEPEIKIACVESPTTGGWGNPLRAEEILRKG